MGEGGIEVGDGGRGGGWKERSGGWKKRSGRGWEGGGERREGCGHGGRMMGRWWWKRGECSDVSVESFPGHPFGDHGNHFASEEGITCCPQSTTVVTGCT